MGLKIWTTIQEIQIMPSYDPFKYAPSCILSSLNVVAPQGNNEWATVNEGGDTGTLTTQEFRDRCLSVANQDNGEGIYSIIAPTELGVVRKFALNEKDKTVTLEGFEQPIPLDEFRKIAVRATEDGKPIVSLAASLSDQWQRVKESGKGDEHFQSIREMSDLYAASTEKGDLFEHHMYSLSTSEMTDGLDYFQLMAKITAIGHRDGPTHARFGLSEAIEGWREVREHPHYMQAPIRFAFDMFMRDMLGDFPDDRVSMICQLHGRVNYSEELEAAGFDILGVLPPFEGKNALPGYKTGDVAFHRGKGVDIVVFSDFMGSYAYAWPTDEGGNFQIEAPAAEFDYRNLMKR
jgi:hypothetical protein